MLAWGDNSFNQTAVPGTATNVIAIAAGYDHSLALKADGTVVVWGRDDSGQVTGTRPILGKILAIIDATHYQLSKNLAAGTSNLFYNGVAGPSSISDGSDIVEADTTNLSANMIVAAPAIVGPVGLTNVVAIAAGAFHSLAVTGDGPVIAWGLDSGGKSPGLRHSQESPKLREGMPLLSHLRMTAPLWRSATTRTASSTSPPAPATPSPCVRI